MSANNSKVPYPRTLIAVLAVSAAGLIGIAQDEGYRDKAYIPVPGDVPTIGFGDTHGVKPGDKTDPVRALIKLGSHVNDAETTLRRCLGDVPMYQHEWDAYVRLSINVGPWAVCKSSIKTKLQAGQYEAACRTILEFNKFQGRVLPGLVSRREREYRVCMGAQS
jgi:lysozyme